MYYFTADEHYGHKNIIRYCRRPFSTVEEMDRELIRRHNEAVREGDVVIHAGDFAFNGKERARLYLAELKGQHIFLRGSHDHWLDGTAHEIWQETIDGQYVVVCHYGMRVWPRSHYNSWQLYGHSHGLLEPIGKQWDIGVDNNDFYPLSFDKIRAIMRERPDNPPQSDVCSGEAAAVARHRAGRLDGGRGTGGVLLRLGDFMRGERSCIFRAIFRSTATMIRPDGLLRGHLCVLDFDPQPELSSLRDGRY